MERPLAGLRILAIEQYGAGPFGTQHLADLGAEVIKVENHRLGGDYARSLGPYYVNDAECDDDASLFFQAINRNKKSLSLDLAHPEGTKVFHRLVAGADAVANNLRGDVPEKLGLTYAALAGVNPKIVCAHCSAYGREGPRRDWPGYDFLMQAETGYFYMSGDPGTEPTRMGLSVVDFLGGTYMALGLLAAVLSARTTGLGRDVDVNLYDTAMSNLSYLSTWALNSDYEPKRFPRSAHATLAPCQLYKTADGWIFIMCNKEKFWPLLCIEIERPDLAKDSRFVTFGDRRRNRNELTVHLDDALSKRKTADWLTKLSGKIPVAPVRTPREALDDPSLVTGGKVQTLNLRKDGASFCALTSPIRTQSVGEDHACPPLGADTDSILRAAGYSASEIEELRQIGVV